MVVARLHSKMFEAAARDLDRTIRLQFLDGALRPEYIRDFEARLNGTNQFAERGAEIGGRLLWAKRIFRKLLRPHLEHQVAMNRMMIERLSEIHYDMSRMAGDAEELRAALYDDMSRRTDQLRDELADEIRRQVGAGRLSAPTTPPIAAGAKLVLGPVPVKRPGYVHVDPMAEGSAPADQLPAEAGTLAEVVVANALEQYTEAEVGRRLLPYWASLLRPGGRLTLIADDVDAAADRFRDGQIGIDELAALILGQGGPARRSAFSADRLGRYVAEAGLVDVSVIERRQRPEAVAYAFELSASRPAA